MEIGIPLPPQDGSKTSVHITSLSYALITNYFKAPDKSAQMKIVFFVLNPNICCGYSKEPVCRCSKISNTSCLPKRPRKTVKSQKTQITEAV